MKLREVDQYGFEASPGVNFHAKHNPPFAKNLNSSAGVNSCLSFCSGRETFPALLTQGNPGHSQSAKPNLVMPISSVRGQNSSNILQYARAHNLYNLQLPCQSSLYWPRAPRWHTSPFVEGANVLPSKALSLAAAPARVWCQQPKTALSKWTSAAF